MCALGRGWAGLGVRSSPACINNLLLSPCRDGMCWEIRQRYLPAQARGRFLLKGETAQAGGHGLRGPCGWSPTLLLSAGLWYLCPPSQYLLSGLSKCRGAGWAVLQAGGEQHLVGLHPLRP